MFQLKCTRAAVEFLKEMSWKTETRNRIVKRAQRIAKMRGAKVLGRSHLLKAMHADGSVTRYRAYKKR